MQHNPVSPGGMGLARGAAGTGCAVDDVVGDGLGRLTQALCISRPQSSSSLCQWQFQILRSSCGTVFNVFTCNNEIKVPFLMRLQILAFAYKGTLPSWECLRSNTCKISFAAFFFFYFLIMNHPVKTAGWIGVSTCTNKLLWKARHYFAPGFSSPLLVKQIDW